ncbi:MAG: serine hydrolase [Deinococcales bacterium]|nr:serine hydrolase [Deinococcales bacterium]
MPNRPQADAPPAHATGAERRDDAAHDAPFPPLDPELASALAALELRLGRAASADANPARLGLVAAPLAPGTPWAEARERALAFRAHEPFTAASTIKVYVLLALLERVAAGELALEEELTVRADDLVSGSGVLKALTPGRRYPLLDLATLMIVVSDNTATNVLIERLGVDAINASIARRGWRGTRLAGKLQLRAAPGAAPRSPSVTTPADLADHFGRLWLGELLPPELSETARRIYRQQQLGELGRGIDHDAYSAEIGEAPWRIASKSGSVRGVRNDAGVFEPLRGGAPYVVAVMTRGCPDERFHQENLGARVVGEAARAVHLRLGG